MKREDVYRLIDGERAYQDSLSSNRTDGREHTVGEFMIMLQYYMDKAVEAWTMNAGDAKALNEIRKIAGICVNCMENHWTEPRK
jgi:hypothetical protein